MNHLAGGTNNSDAIGQVFNTAVGDRTTLIQLTELLKTHLGKFDPKIAEVKIVHGPEREGDIPHSLASVEKAKSLLNYAPSHPIAIGIEESLNWYWKNL